MPPLRRPRRSLGVMGDAGEAGVQGVRHGSGAISGVVQKAGEGLRRGGDALDENPEGAMAFRVLAAARSVTEWLNDGGSAAVVLNEKGVMV